MSGKEKIDNIIASGISNSLPCPLCGRVLPQKEHFHNGWICKYGEFIPEGSAINSITGSSDRLTGEDHRRIGGGSF